MRLTLFLMIIFNITILIAAYPTSMNTSGCNCETIDRPDSTCINPLHVGDKWWFYHQTLWNPNQEPWVTISREVVADTVVNGETYYAVEGIGGGSTNCPTWQINRGDSIFILDTGDFDNNPETDELLFFRWDLNENNETCNVYFSPFGSLEPITQRLDHWEEYALFGGNIFQGKYFVFNEYLVDQTWVKGYGPVDQMIEDGWSQLIACEIDGTFYGDSTVLAVEEPTLRPPTAELACYPNPFNPETNIAFDISRDSEVTITVYNLKGQRVRKLLDRQMEAGSHSIVWNGRDETGKSCGSGVYLIRMRSGQDTFTSKALMMK